MSPETNEIEVWYWQEVDQFILWNQPNFFYLGSWEGSNGRKIMTIKQENILKGDLTFVGIL